MMLLVLLMLLSILRLQFVSQVHSYFASAIAAYAAGGFMVLRMFSEGNLCS